MSSFMRDLSNRKVHRASTVTCISLVISPSLSLSLLYLQTLCLRALWQELVALDGLSLSAALDCCISSYASMNAIIVSNV